MNNYLEFILKMQSIAKIGLKFSKDEYAIENYQEIQDLSKEMLEHYVNDNIEHDNYYVRDIYPTPNVSVRTIVTNEKDEILFVRERVDQLYSVPGGWCDVFKDARTNAMAEVKQESGYEVEIDRILAVFDRSKHAFKKSSIAEYCIYFSAHIVGGKAQVSHETDDVVFTCKDDMPSLSNKNSKDELKIVFDIYYNSKETYFD
ncbi:MAG: NUDIX hydrolase N-terminal domain-containing protein [Erysipelotrichales bacterium]